MPPMKVFEYELVSNAMILSTAGFRWDLTEICPAQESAAHINESFVLSRSYSPVEVNLQPTVIPEILCMRAKSFIP